MSPCQFKRSLKNFQLPTDFALKTDPEFRVWVELYAANQVCIFFFSFWVRVSRLFSQSAFFADFSSAYSRLLALGCPAHVEPDFVDPGFSSFLFLFFLFLVVCFGLFRTCFWLFSVSSEEDFAAQFRHLAMFGSITEAQQVSSLPARFLDCLTRLSFFDFSVGAQVRCARGRGAFGTHGVAQVILLGPH